MHAITCDTVALHTRQHHIDFSVVDMSDGGCAIPVNNRHIDITSSIVVDVHGFVKVMADFGEREA